MTDAPGEAVHFEVAAGRLISRFIGVGTPRHHAWTVGSGVAVVRAHCCAKNVRVGNLFLFLNVL